MVSCANTDFLADDGNLTQVSSATPRSVGNPYRTSAVRSVDLDSVKAGEYRVQGDALILASG